MKTWCRWIAIAMLIVGVVAIRAWLPVKWQYYDMGYELGYERNHCEELKFEQGNLTHILDAMNQDLTREWRERVKADYIQSVTRVLYEFILCGIQKDYLSK